MRSKPVSVLWSTTAAPGTNAPDGSVRVPVMVPDPASWAKAGKTRTTSASAMAPANANIFNKLRSRFIYASSKTIRGSPVLPAYNQRR